MSLKAMQTKDQTLFFLLLFLLFNVQIFILWSFFFTNKIVVHFMLLCWYDLTFYVYCFWRVYHVIIWHICIDLIRWINIKALPLTGFRTLSWKLQEISAKVKLLFPVDAYKREFEFCAVKIFFQLESQYICPW